MTAPIDTPPVPGTLISSTETGLRRTAVHQVTDEEYVWWLRPGDRAQAPLSGPHPGLVPAISAASAADCTFVLPQPHGDGLLHRTRAALPAAFFVGAAPMIRDRLLPTLAPVGTGLARLHRIAAPPVTGPSPAITRLRYWLDGAAPVPGARRLHALALAGWRKSGIDRLRGWAEQACGGPGNLLHGNVSLGILLPLAPAAPGFELLTGADLTSGPAEFDHGWLLGELLELGFVASGRRAGTVPVPAGADLARGLTPAGLDPDLVGRAMVLRLVTHMHDFAAYMPWNDELTDYIDLVRTLLDSEPGDLYPGTCHD